MQVGVETLQTVGAHRQFGDPEQRLLQLLRTFALQYFGLQFDVRQLERLGALAHPAFEFDLRGLAVERGEDVLGDVFEQGAVLVAVALRTLVVLDHDRAADLALAQQRDAQPVFAERAAGVILAADPERGENVQRRADQRFAVPQQRLGHAVHALVHRIFGGRVGIEAVATVGEVEIADAAALLVVLDDVEILRRHQSADHAVDPRQHLAHLQIGAGEVGDLIQRLLQPLGFLQGLDPRVRLGQAQRGGDQFAGHREPALLRPIVWRGIGQAQAEDGAVAILAVVAVDQHARRRLRRHGVQLRQCRRAQRFVAACGAAETETGVSPGDGDTGAARQRPDERIDRRLRGGRRGQSSPGSFLRPGIHVVGAEHHAPSIYPKPRIAQAGMRAEDR